MEEKVGVTGGGSAWSLGLFTRQRVPNDVPEEDGGELSFRNAEADHLRTLIRSPRSMPEHPSMDAPLHRLLENSDDFSVPMERHQREILLLEGWLNLMLRRPSPPVSSRYSFSMSVDTDETGLMEYNLSREQLAKYGLSQAEVERGYRMLYVYSAGCYDVIRELCIHSLGKSFLVGCFWRAFLRLCEEHSKIGLRVEIADLVDQKKKAQDELRVTRGCLNGALDRLSLEFMKQINLTETLAEETAMQDARQREVVDLLRRLDESEAQIHDLAKKYYNSEQARLKAIAQAVDASRMMKRAKLDEHNASMNEARKIDEVDALKAKLLKLEEALGDEKMQGKKLHQIAKRVEEELFAEQAKVKDNKAIELEMNHLRHELVQKNSQVTSLEDVNEAMRRDCRELQALKTKLESRVSGLDKELAERASSVVEMQHLVHDKTRICDEKTLEASFLANEVQSWVEGNEKLLAEQEKLVLEILHLRGLLVEKRSQSLEATQALRSLISKKEESIRALAVGVVALARMAQARPRFITLRPSMINREYANRVEQSHKVVASTGAAIPTGRLDEAGEEFCRLKDDLHKMEGSTKEERDKRFWLEKQSGEASRLLSQQKLELSDADERVANLASEKRTLEQLLRIADDELCKLRGKMTDLRVFNEEQSKKMGELQEAQAESIVLQASNSDKLLELEAALAKESEARKHFEKIAAALQQQVTHLEWCLKDVTDKYNRTLAKKVKWKGMAIANAAIIEQLQSEVSELKSKFEPLLSRNRELEYMIKDEKHLREEAENKLKELTEENNKLQAEVKGLETLLWAAQVDKRVISRKATRLSIENECLMEERTKEMIIREILQKEVDALRLLTESLKMRLCELESMASTTHAESEKSQVVDDQVHKLEHKIQDLLTSRAAEEEKLLTNIQLRLSAAEIEKSELQVAATGGGGADHVSGKASIQGTSKQ